MSQVVSTQNVATSNNANQAAVSTPKDIDLVSCVARQASRQVKAGSSTRERYMLNKSKLFSAVCSEVKSLLGLEKTLRLNEEMADKINSAVDSYIIGRIAEVNPTNCRSVTKSFKHDSRNLQVVEKVSAIGENLLSLKEQLLGIHILQRTAEKRLTDLQAKKSPNYEAEENVKKYIAKLNLTETHISAQLQAMEDLNKQ